MPTVRPRVAVTLDSESFEAVRYLAIASDTSMSKIISELVQSVTPVLARTAELFALAKRAKSQQAQGLIDVSEQAVRELAPIHAQAMAVFQAAAARVEVAAAAPAARKRAPRAAATKGDPRPSNTGVRSRLKSAANRVRRGRQK